MARKEIKEDVINDEEEELELDQYLVFTAKSQEFGIQAVRVQEISTILPTTMVPNAPVYIEGIMNLRGRLASVINFRKKLGFDPKEYDEDTRIIVVELNTYPIGIIVDSVEEVIKIPEEQVQRILESTTTFTSKEYMTGVGMLENRLVILLDVDKVLNNDEMLELGDIHRIINEAGEVSDLSKIIQTTEKSERKTRTTKRKDTGLEQLKDKSNRQSRGRKE